MNNSPNCMSKVNGHGNQSGNRLKSQRVDAGLLRNHPRGALPRDLTCYSTVGMTQTS
jgi:hypothetical protein